SVSVEERRRSTFLVAFGFEVCAKVRDRNTVLFALLAVADRYCTVLFFGIAHDQHIRQAIVVTAPNLAADGPRARLDFGSKAVEFVSYRFRVVAAVVAHSTDTA